MSVSKPKPTITHIRPDAVDMVLPGLALLLKACVEDGASLGFVLPFSLDAAQRFWRTQKDGIVNQSQYLVIAQQGDAVLACGMLSLVDQPNSPHRANIAKVMVHPDARGQGLARQILEGLEALARQLGRTTLVLDTETGSSAEALYSKLDYKRSGIIEDYALDPAGKMISTSVYYKVLR